MRDDLFIPLTRECTGCKFKLMLNDLKYKEARNKVVAGGGGGRRKFSAGICPSICSNGDPKFIKPTLRPGGCLKPGGGPRMDFTLGGKVKED
jgi:hypothetical protein